MDKEKKWSGWKSPVGLGFFFITTSIALAVLLYTVLNVVVSVTELVHPAAAASAGLTQQELQQELGSGTGE